MRTALLATLGALVFALSACAKRSLSPAPHLAVVQADSSSGPKRSLHKLSADAVWQVNVPSSDFDASGLLWHEGKLLLVGDKSAVVYEIRLPATNAPAEVREFTRCFVEVDNRSRVDCEGITVDDQGRLLIVDEPRRRALRATVGQRGYQELKLDLGPAERFFSADKNAAFEGIAFGAGKLYFANERQQERIIVVDPETGIVLSHFVAEPSGQNLFWHYSDLSWCDGKLFVLLRHPRVILEIDPATQNVIAEYNFRDVEARRDVEYSSLLNTGTMEGLAVTKDEFWLITDNNGQARKHFPKDKRPTLVRCPRPQLP
ncbi:MAG TPA: esterase-like activity of phytase family protein [Methylomirabilota bacterium]|nr:esterase-like activity of phytase family protein [Methylomirabilota bacterium]